MAVIGAELPIGERGISAVAPFRSSLAASRAKRLMISLCAFARKRLPATQRKEPL